MKHTTFSLWGAAGSFVVLQTFGLFLFYVFADTIVSIAGKEIEETLRNVIRLPALLLVLSLLILAERALRDLPVEILRDYHTLDPWLQELRTRRGLIRAVILPLLIVFYAVVLMRPHWVRIPQTTIIAGLIFQAFHLFLCWWHDATPIQNNESADSSETAVNEEETGGCLKKMLTDGILILLFLGFSSLISEPSWFLVIVAAAILTFLMTGFLLDEVNS